MGRFVGADPEDLAFVPNATAGVDTVLRSLRFEAGDEILATDMEYNACRNAAEFIAASSPAWSQLASLSRCSPQAGHEGGLGRVTDKTRLALLSHITSPTGSRASWTLVRELQGRGIDVLVDGAHAPGQVPLDLARLDAAYYTGNCHKWLCAPKGAAFLHVRRDRQERIRPLVISQEPTPAARTAPVSGSSSIGPDRLIHPLSLRADRYPVHGRSRARAVGQKS